MAEHEIEDDQALLITRLFGLLTAKLEDAAGIAAGGTDQRQVEELLSATHEIIDLAQEAITLASAAAALLQTNRSLTS